jgi:integrase
VHVTPETLRRFRESLLEQGLSDGSARLYAVLVERCARDGRDARGMVTRLTGHDLAPKSLRNNRSALMAWATFAEDAPLLLKVKRIRLPPPLRSKPKIAITPDEWKGIVRAIQDSDESPAMRAVLFLMAVRGFRVGDVLRLRRGDITAALRTGRLSFTAKGRKRLEYDATPIRPALIELADHRGWEVVEDLIVGPHCRSEGFNRRHAASCRVREALTRITADAGTKVNPHDLRRMYALSFLRRLGKDPQALQKLSMHVGWAGIQTAALYVDEVSRDELDQVGNQMAEELLEET